MYPNPPGPSQPEWRLPPPQQQQPATAATTSTTTGTTGAISGSPSPQPPPAYNPNAFGPMPGAAPVATGLNTAAWGVRFNHHQLQTYSPSPPPLPVSIQKAFFESIWGSPY